MRLTLYLLNFSTKCLLVLDDDVLLEEGADIGFKAKVPILGKFK
jgi:hypothetical protein